MAQLTVLDRIISIEPGKGARAVRNFTNTLPLLSSHFPRFPVMPGVLILGCMAELARLLLHEQTDRSWRLAGAAQVRYRHYVQPGDQLELAVDLRTLDSDAAVFSASATVEGRLVTSARTLRMIPCATGPAR